MKWKNIIVILIIIVVVVATAVIICNLNSISNYFDDEPAIENDISLKAKEIHDYMRENGYGYCTYDNRCNHDGECGLNVTFEGSKTGHKNTCCATYVSWVLQECGYVTRQEHIDNNLNGANNLIRFLERSGWQEVDKQDIMPGDILCYNGHVAIYGGKGRQYDAGSRKMIETVAPCRLAWGMSVSKILRKTE